MNSKLIASWGLLFASLSPVAESQVKRPITPADCVNVRYLNPDDLTGATRLNLQGTEVAYVVKAANIPENRNDDELYVKEISSSSLSQSKRIASASDIANIRWLKDGRHFTVLINKGSRSSISVFDALTGDHAEWVHVDGDIKEYSIDADGNVIIFAAEVDNRESAAIELTSEQRARGYLVSSQVGGTAYLPHRKLFVAKREDDGSWSSPRPLAIRLPFSTEPAEQIPYSVDLHLSLSPNGEQALFNYVNGTDLPDDWKQDPTVRAMAAAGLPGVVITTLYDLHTGAATIPLPSPGATQTPVWSEDSSSYITFVFAPVGSEWVHSDERAHLILTTPGMHMIWVRPSTKEAELIPARVADTRDTAVLFWDTAAHTVGIRTQPDLIESFEQHANSWRVKSAMRIPIQHFPHYAQLTSNGKIVVGDVQATTKPPELFLFNTETGTVNTFAKLNPEFDSLDIAPVREVHWKTSTGFEQTGVLFLPTHYDPSQRYPVVIATKYTRGEFACDAGSFHSPSFAPQPVANAGMMYLMGYTPEGTNPRAEEAFYPKGYPGTQGIGGVAEAAFYMDVWDSAVDALAAQGLIDPNKLGIIGFSRTGWHTEFILAHSKHHYRAATVADNIQYSLSEYWLYHSDSVNRSFEAVYGGSPYGSSLENWQKYSISFNLEKFHTPLLMEEMGNGVVMDRASIPWALATTAEVFAGLARLKKPVEMYLYPNEVHQPDHPQARLASLQRNLDWYRFWLQGYERANPEDAEQFTRWNHLRELRDADVNH
jgi:dipeptidyl aminopeptidase/acylaminoacyl peptidase